MVTQAPEADPFTINCHQRHLLLSLLPYQTSSVLTVPSSKVCKTSYRSLKNSCGKLTLLFSCSINNKSIFSPLVQAELSVLVDILYRPENLFPANTEARTRCESGGFISKLINHTERLLEEKEDKLCVKVLETLKEMMALDPDYEEKVL